MVQLCIQVATWCQCMQHDTPVHTSNYMKSMLWYQCIHHVQLCTSHYMISMYITYNCAYKSLYDINVYNMHTCAYALLHDINAYNMYNCAYKSLHDINACNMYNCVYKSLHDINVYNTIHLSAHHCRVQHETYTAQCHVAVRIIHLVYYARYLPVYIIWQLCLYCTTQLPVCTQQHILIPVCTLHIMPVCTQHTQSAWHVLHNTMYVQYYTTLYGFLACETCRKCLRAGIWCVSCILTSLH